ncbi:EPIDERMAL PATTERNING FACTOR-like protein 4 [Mangifera indica]|uniref:EPIDERMAL PATTERNING FACTOR-like protein 4 n=1 Tax=Mangifera indica TaxID=29780 RepID=UPI001CFB6DC7|nr:EPIDERMAL PATTERNING FACTOR-like protein 4 [Mangifera indica]
MKSIIFYIFVAILEISTLLSLTSRNFASDNQDQFPQFLEAASDFKRGFYQSTEARTGEETYKVESRLGSRPPCCIHKCEGCEPCVAIQTPTTSDRMGLQYANYEPEGWKCKCGSSLFNP